jgi:hypothetical protein
MVLQDALAALQPRAAGILNPYMPGAAVGDQPSWYNRGMLPLPGGEYSARSSSPKSHPSAGRAGWEGNAMRPPADVTTLQAEIKVRLAEIDALKARIADVQGSTSTPPPTPTATTAPAKR